MNKRNDELAAVIAKHYGVDDLESCPDADLVGNIIALVEKIHGAGLGPSSIKGLVNAEGVRQILNLGSIPATRVTMSRDKNFPEPVVEEKLWSATDIKKYSLAREASRIGAPGRPPMSSRRHSAGE